MPVSYPSWVATHPVAYHGEDLTPGQTVTAAQLPALKPITDRWPNFDADQHLVQLTIVAEPPLVIPEIPELPEPLPAAPPDEPPKPPAQPAKTSRAIHRRHG